MDKKRERGKNYTDKEKEELIGIVSKYVNIVENKKTDNKTIKAKNTVWNEIAKEFYIVSQTGERSTAQLKMLYEGLKKKAKKDKKEAFIDGKTDQKLNNISLKILTLLENKISDQTDNLDITNILKIESNNDKDNFDMFLSTLPFSETDTVNSNLNSPIIQEDIFKISDKNVEKGKSNPDLIAKSSKRKLEDEYYVEKHKIKIDILNIKKEKEECIRDITYLEKREKEIEILIKEEYLNQLKNKNT